MGRVEALRKLLCDYNRHSFYNVSHPHLDDQWALSWLYAHSVPVKQNLRIKLDHQQLIFGSGSFFIHQDNPAAHCPTVFNRGKKRMTCYDIDKQQLLAMQCCSVNSTREIFVLDEATCSMQRSQAKGRYYSSVNGALAQTPMFVHGSGPSWIKDHFMEFLREKMACVAAKTAVQL